MKSISRVILILLMILSCSEQNEFVFPLIQTGEVTGIDSTGVVFHARISDLSKDNIEEFGFIWGPESKQGLNPSRIILNETPANGIFSAKLETDLLADTVYYVQAFAKNVNYTTYGKVVKFKSMGSLTPEIIDFNPKEGSAGTQVTITGKNFSPALSGNIVKFGKAIATVVDATNDRLIVTLPNDLNVSGIVKITVESSNHVVYSGSTFFLNGCNIVSFTPDNLMIGDTIYIQATDIGASIPNNTLRIGGSVAEILGINGNTLMAYVPYNPKLAYNEVTLTVNGKTCYSTDSVYLKNPWSKIDGAHSFYRSEVNGFAIGSKGYIGFGMSAKNPGVGPYKDLWEYNFVSNSWQQCPDLPAVERKAPIAFSIGTKGYVGLGQDNYSTFYNDLYEYDPNSSQWTRKADFPGEGRAGTFEIAIGNRAFAGMGFNLYSSFKDFWEYNPGNDHWTQLTDYPGAGITNVIGFENKGKGYIGLAGSAEFWEYSPSPGTWKKLADFPGEIREGSVAFSIGDFCYTGLGTKANEYIFLNDFWRYDIKSDKWVRLADMTYVPRTGSVSYSIGDKGYICSGVNVYVPTGNNDENFIVFNPNQVSK